VNPSIVDVESVQDSDQMCDLASTDVCTDCRLNQDVDLSRMTMSRNAFPMLSEVSGTKFYVHSRLIES
jgi:hypothetical protein